MVSNMCLFMQLFLSSLNSMFSIQLDIRSNWFILTAYIVSLCTNISEVIILRLWTINNAAINTHALPHGKHLSWW